MIARSRQVDIGGAGARVHINTLAADVKRVIEAHVGHAVATAKPYSSMTLGDDVVRATDSFRGETRADDVVIDAGEDDVFYGRVLQLLMLEDDGLGRDAASVAIIQWYDESKVRDPHPKCDRLVLSKLVDCIPIRSIYARVDLVPDYINQKGRMFVNRYLFGSRAVE